MSKHYVRHMNSIFEFAEPARFETSQDGGFFVSTNTGMQVFSTDRLGRYSSQKMQALRDAAKFADAEDQRELENALKALYEADADEFCVIRHPTDLHPNVPTKLRSLLIVVHPGDVIDLPSDWGRDYKQIAGSAECVERSVRNQIGMTKEIYEMLKTHDIVILHRSSSQFIALGTRGFKAAIDAINEVAIVTYGDDLDKATDWMIQSGITSNRPNIFMTGAYADEEHGCITAIGKRILENNPTQDISVSEFAPDGGEPDCRWMPDRQSNERVASAERG